MKPGDSIATKRELYNANAEKDVLVAATLSKEALFKVLDMDENDFYFEKNRIIFQAMSELNGMDVPVTLQTLFTKLKDMNMYDKCGGDRLIYDFTGTVMAYTVPYLIQDIQTKRKERELLAATTDLFQAITQGIIDIEEAGEKMLRMLGEMNAPKDIEYRSTFDLANTSFDELFTSGGFIESKLSSVRKILKYYDGQLITIAGRPGKGKSAFALQTADDLALAGERVLYFSLEMKSASLFARLLSRHSGIEANRIKAVKINSDELPKLLHAQDLYRQNGKMIIYDVTYHISKLANVIRRECERERPRAIFIDYLQLIPGGEGNSQAERIGYITRTLKLLAMQFSIPIFILSQLNRQIEINNREPDLSDLRDSGRIEEDSDVVVFLHSEKDDREKVKFIIAKNRDGSVGFVHLYFNTRLTVFQDYEQQIIDGPQVKVMDYIHN